MTKITTRTNANDGNSSAAAACLSSRTNMFGRAATIVLVASSLIYCGAATPDACAAPVLINFDAVVTPIPIALGADPTSYLAGFGVSLANVTAGTTMGVKTTAFDTNLILLSSPNYMSQWWGGVNGTSYDLMFDQPLESLYVSIPQITSGVSVPFWSLTALDASGTPLVTTYGQAFFSGASARRTFEFLSSVNPDMQGLRVYSNVNGNAGMGGIPLDDIEFTSIPTVPEPSTLALAALSLMSLGMTRRRRRC